MTLVLSAAELERLFMPTMGKNLLEERRAKQKRLAKTRANAPVIASAEEQNAANRARATQAIVRDNQKRKEEQMRQQEAQRQMRVDQQRLANELREAEAQQFAQDNGADPPKRPAPPSKLSRLPQNAGTPGSSASELPTPSAPPPKPVEPSSIFHPLAKNFADIDDASRPNPTSDAFVGTVVSVSDMVVLCAPWADGKLYTWNELEAPPADQDRDWNAWLVPGNWVGFVQSIYNGDAATVTIGAGSYNTLYTPTSASPLNDAKRWPPQLKALGVAGAAGPTASGLRLPDREYVIRMTSPDLEDGRNKSVSRDQAIFEVAYSLHMASIGAGPQILAAVIWPWKDETGNLAQQLQSYGVLMVTDRADYNLKEYVDDVKKTFLPSGALQQRPLEYFNKAIKLGEDLIHLCYNIAVYGFVHFDIKPGNILTFRSQNMLRAIDFDDSFFVKPGFETAGRKACFFVNLLLISMHIRTSMSRDFVDAYVSIVGRVLLDVWQECFEERPSFGAGAKWLKNTTIAQSQYEGKFDRDKLANMSNNSQRASAMLRSLHWEYFQNRSATPPPPERVLAWAGWKSRGFVSAPKLVPQMLSYILFFSSPNTPPFQFREILAY